MAIVLDSSGSSSDLRHCVVLCCDNLSAKDIISRHTSKPERGFFLFYNPPINFLFAIKPRVNMVKKASGTSFSMSLSLHSLKRVWFPSMLITEEKKS